MTLEQDAREYATTYAATAHDVPPWVVRKTTQIGRQAQADAEEILRRQGKLEVIEAKPEPWYWGWPFWAILTIAVGYFTWQIFIR